jgi:hypothetical protein
MERIPVVSSNIVSVRYDPEARTLDVEFKNGAVYQYADVPQEEYDGFLSSDSKGRYHNARIKSYSYVRL